MRSWLKPAKTLPDGSLRIRELTVEYLNEKLSIYSSSVTYLKEICKCASNWMKSIDLYCEAVIQLGTSFSAFFGRDNFKSGCLQCSVDFTTLFEDKKLYLLPKLKRMIADRCLQPISLILKSDRILRQKEADYRSNLLELNSIRSKWENEILLGKETNSERISKLSSMFDVLFDENEQLKYEILSILNDFEANRSSLLGREFCAIVGSAFYEASETSAGLSDLLSSFPIVSSTLCCFATMPNIVTDLSEGGVRKISNREDKRNWFSSRRPDEFSIPVESGYLEEEGGAMRWTTERDADERYERHISTDEL